MSVEGTNRVERDPGEIAAFGPFRLLPAARRLEREGKPVEVGGCAFDVLMELVNRAGRVVSKAELMSAIWPHTAVVEGVIRTHVYGLRKALGDGVGGARYVTCVAGRGYCFVAPVVRSVDERTKAADLDSWHPPALPPRLARMAGRDDVVRILVARLLEHRLVTLVGAAGIGKTTVAVAVGHALLDEFDGAVRFIDLASLTDPALVAPTVASTLGLAIQSDDAIDRLQAFLRDKRTLLVLDNCEHLVDAAASLVERLFIHAPRVHLLATSREALRVEGERAHCLGPLEAPTEALGVNVDAVKACPAVQVLLERAAASGWSEKLTAEDVPIVVETCRRLDGVPLALELAGSFVGQSGLRGMADALHDRLRLLWQRGRRTAPPRQQTIHALIAWSYDRLVERERAVLRRLSVFVDTFSLDGAKAVVLQEGDSAESLAEVMNNLISKSLVTTSVEHGAVVYRLLETTRVYAMERLAECDELDRMSLRHAELFARRLDCENAQGGRGSPRRRGSLLANVRAALKWTFSSPAIPAVGVPLAAAAASMLLKLGLVSECQNWSRQALDVIGEPDVGTDVELRLQEAFAVAGMASTGYTDEVRTALMRGLELARALGGGDQEVRLLDHLNVFFLRTGDFRGGLEVAQQCVVGAARTGTTAGAVTAQWMLGRSHCLCGNLALARTHCEEGMRLARESGRSPTMFLGYTPAVLTLARALWLRGQADRAKTLAVEIVREAAALGHPIDATVRLFHCAPIFIWRGDWGDAESLLTTVAEHVERYSLASFRGMVMGLRGDLLVKVGRPQEGLALLEKADSLLKAARSESHGTYIAGLLAEAYAVMGSLTKALATIERAVAEAESRGSTWDLPELLRIKGVVLASSSSATDGGWNDTLSSAIALARHQGALTWELRATMALARERLKRASPGRLHDLSVLCAKFTEGIQAPDLQAAHELLDGEPCLPSIDSTSGSPTRVRKTPRRQRRSFG
jgi:predicted ATPase/DNA-binding winged helix-turn-helix (wHTH) protein